MGLAEGGIRWRKSVCVGLSLKRLGRLVALIYLALLTIGLFLSDWLIFPYRQSSYGQDLRGLEFIESSDGQRLAVRYWGQPGARGVVVLFHGNAEDLGHLDWIANEICDCGVSVLAMDYRGYGLSEGEPSEEGCYADAESVYELALEKGYAPGDVLVWGRSVGGGPATELAVRKKVRGLVLESSFVTAFRALTRVPLLPFDKFDNLTKLRGLDVPLFVIHGTEDEVVGYWHGEKLHAAYGGRKQMYAMEGAGHNDLWAYDTGDMSNRVRAFFGFDRGGAGESGGTADELK